MRMRNQLAATRSLVVVLGGEQPEWECLARMDKKKGKEEKRSSHHPNPLFDQLEVIRRPLFIGNYTGVDCCVDSKQDLSCFNVYFLLFSPTQSG
ncbi:uncharacterized protein [Lolium perenne]|uniref:uncharacterized protein isoform X3 n=1 Tax=Lolium perenne TaxID=4522 RepID=UPI003A9905CF